MSINHVCTFCIFCYNTNKLLIVVTVKFIVKNFCEELHPRPERHEKSLLLKCVPYAPYFIMTTYLGWR